MFPRESERPAARDIFTDAENFPQTCPPTCAKYREYHVDSSCGFEIDLTNVLFVRDEIMSK